MINPPDSDLINWLLIPLAIFFARILDVSLGTLRIVFLSRGKRNIAPILGFFEVLIWILAISQIMRNLGNAASYIAYAAGFAAGNYIGLIIEERLAIGLVAIRIFVIHGADVIVKKVHEVGYGVTKLCGEGSEGAVDIVYSIVQRKDLKKIKGIIDEVNPRAFFIVEEVRVTHEGIFPKVRSGIQLFSGVIKRK
jgi:uncharacterized protein YebE (UPF0316 family)